LVAEAVATIAEAVEAMEIEADATIEEAATNSFLYE